MKTVFVNNFEIGFNRTFVVADIGSNHKQDLSIAKESIDAAAQAGADAIKFQSINLEHLYTNPDYLTTDFIRKLEFPEDWHEILSEYCLQKQIVFFSSPTYLKAVDLLEDVNVPLYKIASAQVGTFPQIVERVASLMKPTIISTGISNYNQIIEAVRIFESVGNKQYMILHCNSIYPAPADRINLPLMNTYKSMFGCQIGFSDHTEGIHIPVAAVAMGAKIIEKHFTLSRNFDTPDSTSFASDAAEFEELVFQIREVESAMKNLGSRIDIQNEEEEFKNSIIYRAKLTKDVSKGELIRYDSLDYSRYHEGIDCREVFFNRNFGKARHDLNAGMILKWEDVDKESK